jgi:predicted enzyme related to lactoylglutathione lyase
MNDNHAAGTDITVSDTRAFYTELFGWRLRLVKQEDQGAGITTYFSVPDVELMLVRAEALGATVATPPWTVPGLGRMAVILDPDGNRVGLWQD